MFATSLLWTPLVVLGFCMLFVNGWKLWFQCNYITRPLFFAAVYFIALTISFLPQPFHLFPSDFVWIGGVATAYVLFSWVWEARLSHVILPGTREFSVPQQDVAPPKTMSALPKVLEVLLQDVALISLVLLLLNYSSSLVVVTLAGVFVVAFTHAPAPMLFGRFYGWFFLVAGVGWASVLPYLIKHDLVWLGELYAIHLGMYVFMYFLALLRTART